MDCLHQEWLNNKLDRTEFMPFAPAILEEDACEYLKDYPNGASFSAEFMTVTYDVTEKCRKNAPAVVHVDGSARPQIVRIKANPQLHAILNAYKKRTGLPLLINTSFNHHEEPIVNSPDDAIRAFQKSELDFLALGPFLVQA